MEFRRYIVRGRVQGVGFRYFVAGEARRLGVAGWVRNNLNGAVEVLAGGNREQLANLHRALQRGPSAARVDQVEVMAADAPAETNTFRIEGNW